MRVRFWGTRGSLAVPGPETLRYGGNTSCVQVESEGGTLVVVDCGTGIRGLGRALTADGDAPERGAVLISHTHWDHIQGFPFFSPLFAPGSEWDVYGPRGMGESLRDTLAGQMQYTYFPITLDAMGAEIRYHNLVEGAFDIDDIHVRTHYLNHPVLTLGYRLEVDGASMVYACDHEPYEKEAVGGEVELRGEDRAHVEFLAGADVLVHDAQFTAEEYPSRTGWGHSPVEYVLRVAREAEVEHLVLTHHDPARTDVQLDAILEEARADAAASPFPVEVSMAEEGRVIELRPQVAETRRQAGDDALREDRTVSGHRIALALPPSSDAQILEEVAAQDDIQVARVAPAAETGVLAGLPDPTLVFVPGDDDGLETAGRIRALDAEWAREATVVAVSSELVEHAAVDDWLRSPFTAEYARTRVRSWLLRQPARWTRAPLPDDEADRLATLRRLGLLDTGSEERFDRITRLASAVLGAPVSLVSLVDEDRQWFKSAQGWERGETSRDASFCAHAILDDHPFVVSDASADDRFADNPMVAGEPEVRFYAGYPLSAPDGHRVGSLCVIDRRARELSPRELQLLEDLARLAEEELARSAA